MNRKKTKEKSISALPGSSPEKPVIVCSARQLPELVAEVLAAVRQKEAGRNLSLRNGMVVTVESAQAVQ